MVFYGARKAKPDEMSEAPGSQKRPDNNAFHFLLPSSTSLGSKVPRRASHTAAEGLGWASRFIQLVPSPVPFPLGLRASVRGAWKMSLHSYETLPLSQSHLHLIAVLGPGRMSQPVTSLLPRPTSRWRDKCYTWPKHRPAWTSGPYAQVLGRTLPFCSRNSQQCLPIHFRVGSGLLWNRFEVSSKLPGLFFKS